MICIVYEGASIQSKPSHAALAMDQRADIDPGRSKHIPILHNVL